MQNAHRRRGSYSCRESISCALLLVFQLVWQLEAAPLQRLLTQATSSISRLDLLDGGSCGPSGCRREAVWARAQVMGAPLPGDQSCTVAEGDEASGFAAEDTDLATLGIVHRCQDSDGQTLPQVGYG